ncbi:MAG: hypothetical protein DRJ15_13565 [Bacteroidetes bacterium]|nr:MAG: hypothetical protein DRJ15_13565 [Bacteroidota bacterium]
MKKTILLAMALAISASLLAQIQTSISQSQKYQEQDKVKEYKRSADFGFGVGTDYGGIVGIKATFTPLKYLGFFGAAGYYKIDFGWSLGLNFYFIPKTNKNNIRPYAKVMYGTNRAIIIDGADEYDKVYAGLSPGIGCEFRFGATTSHGLNIALNFPISSSDFKNDYDAVKNDPAIQIEQDILPIAFSIGYHFEI